MRCLPVSLTLNCPPFTGVLREIARHECVEEIVICELDQGVIDVSKKYLPSLAKGYDDPRVTVHVMDGAVFMEQNKDYFDVVRESSDSKPKDDPISLRQRDARLGLGPSGRSRCHDRLVGLAHRPCRVARRDLSARLSNP